MNTKAALKASLVFLAIAAALLILVMNPSLAFTVIDIAVPVILIGCGLFIAAVAWAALYDAFNKN